MKKLPNFKEITKSSKGFALVELVIVIGILGTFFLILYWVNPSLFSIVFAIAIIILALIHILNDLTNWLRKK